VFPIWLGFRGGKGVATGAAVAAALAPSAALVSLAVFIAVAAAARYVSLASLCAAAVLPAAYAALHRGGAFSGSVFGFCAGAAALVFLMHRKNIRRLLRGEEPKLGGKE
jgi:glycerol-3-phosphate acyltransferase PlsY